MPLTASDASFVGVRDVVSGMEVTGIVGTAFCARARFAVFPSPLFDVGGCEVEDSLEVGIGELVVGEALAKFALGGGVTLALVVLVFPVPWLP